MQTHCSFCTRELYCGHDRDCPYWQPRETPDRDVLVSKAREARAEAYRTGSTLDDLAAVLAERNLCIFDANDYAASKVKTS